MRGDDWLGQAQRTPAAARSWKINSGACGRMLTDSLQALPPAKGIYHVKEAIAFSTLQIAPFAYAHAHTHRCSHKRACSRAGPFHLIALRGREGIYSLWQWHSVVLLEMELSPSNLRHCRELAHVEPRVLWPSCPTSRGGKLSVPGTTPSIQPRAGWWGGFLFARSEVN